MTIERDQDDRFYSSEISELRQPYTPIGITDETLDETTIINENGQENADHHNIQVWRQRQCSPIVNYLYYIVVIVLDYCSIVLE